VRHARSNPTSCSFKVIRSTNSSETQRRDRRDMFLAQYPIYNTLLSHGIKANMREMRGETKFARIWRMGTPDNDFFQNESCESPLARKTLKSSSCAGNIHRRSRNSVRDSKARIRGMSRLNIPGNGCKQL
jgi:hypothetical protein